MNSPINPVNESDAWERAEDEHLRDSLRLTFKDRLKWIEEAARVASRLCPAHAASSDSPRSSSRTVHE